LANYNRRTQRAELWSSASDMLGVARKLLKHWAQR